MATKNKGQRPTEKGIPGSSSTRLEKSRKLAQKRRETYKDLMSGIMESLPFTREVLSQLDYNSRLRLSLCYLKMKAFLEPQSEEGDMKMIQPSPTDDKPVIFQPGALQELMIEAMDGFLIVLLSDGSIVYLSESIHKHLGLFQSEHMGSSLYDLALEEDHTDVKQALASAEARAHTRLGSKRVSVPCSFFCRMKCSRNKVANTQSMSPGFKVVHTSGHFRLRGREAFMVGLVKPVTPSSILEIRMEGNMFVTHYALDMRCIFFDGRLPNLMGYRREDLTDKLAFDLHHHEDTDATLECSKGVQARGEGMSGYYRMLTKHGHFVWLQTRATMMFDSHTGNPSYIVCMNFIINKETGYKSLKGRKALPPPPPATTDVDSKTSDSFISEINSKAHDPFPIPREDGKPANPLDEQLVQDTNIASSTGGTEGISHSPPTAIKSEETSPPLSDEQPSSTTDRKPESTEIDAPSSDGQFGSSSGCHGDVVPSSSSGVVLSRVSDDIDCVPDSTTVSTSSVSAHKEPSIIQKGTDSGYDSRINSSSASAHQSPQSDSTAGLCSTSTPSLTPTDNTNKVFSVAASSIPIQSYSHSSSTSGTPAIYQDPVIQTELQSLSCSQQQSSGYHDNNQQNQQSFGYRGNDQSCGYHGNTTNSATSQLSHQSQPVVTMKQDILSQPLPACQYSNPIPSGSRVTWNGDSISGGGSSSFPYQMMQQQQHGPQVQQQNETRVAPAAANFDFTTSQQQPLQHYQQQQNVIQQNIIPQNVEYSLPPPSHQTFTGVPQPQRQTYHQHGQQPAYINTLSGQQQHPGSTVQQLSYPNIQPGPAAQQQSYQPGPAAQQLSYPNIQPGPAAQQPSYQPGPAAQQPSYQPGPAAQQPSYQPGPAAQQPSYQPGPAAQQPSYQPGPAAQQPSYQPGPAAQQPSYQPGPAAQQQSYPNMQPGPAAQQQSYQPGPTAQQQSYPNMQPGPAAQQQSYPNIQPGPTAQQQSYPNMQPGPTAQQQSYPNIQPGPTAQQQSYPRPGPTAQQQSYPNMQPGPTAQQLSYPNMQPRPAAQQPFYPISQQPLSHTPMSQQQDFNQHGQVPIPQQHGQVPVPLHHQNAQASIPLQHGYQQSVQVPIQQPYDYTTGGNVQGPSSIPQNIHGPSSIAQNLTQPSLGVDPQQLPSFSSVGVPYQSTTSAAASFGSDTMATECHMTPNLTSLTGEDLQILEFIDQMDTTGQTLNHLREHHTK